MDDHPVPHNTPKQNKTFLQIILAAKWLVRHSNTSPNRQRRPLPSLLSDSDSMTWLYSVHCRDWQCRVSGHQQKRESSPPCRQPVTDLARSWSKKLCYFNQVCGSGSAFIFPPGSRREKLKKKTENSLSGKFFFKAGSVSEPALKKQLDLDPYPQKMNADPQLWFLLRVLWTWKQFRSDSDLRIPMWTFWAETNEKCGQCVLYLLS